MAGFEPAILRWKNLAAEDSGQVLLGEYFNGKSARQKPPIY